MEREGDDYKRELPVFFFFLTKKTSYSSKIMVDLWSMNHLDFTPKSHQHGRWRVKTNGILVTINLSILGKNIYPLFVHFNHKVQLEL